MTKRNPLKIGKYTFWVSFIIGNIFMFGFLFFAAIYHLSDYTVKCEDIALKSAALGHYYLYVATAVNLAILFSLLVWGIARIEKRKNCFTAIRIMLINIPLAILYAFVGLGLVTGKFSFKELLEVLLFQY